MKVAFYKGKGDWVDWAIRKWTRSPYSHCEIVIDNTWYSSSARDGGVRKKNIHHNPENWDFIDIKIQVNDKNIIKMFFNKQIGKKYDYVGILLSQVIPLHEDIKNRWFCSEICAYTLQLIDILPKDKKSNWYSPGRLYKRLS